jgi:hypothetical protein
MESERLYWDQAAVLSQLGLIDPSLPFADATEIARYARRVLNVTWPWRVQPGRVARRTAAQSSGSDSVRTAQHELKNVHRTIRSLVGMHPATDWSPASID